MPKAIRQENLYGAEDWTVVYSSFKNAEFRSYDFDTLRQSMIDYVQFNYPEEFNDYTQNSEFIALVDLVAYVGQNLAFRMDLNARENILDTAEKRESVLRIARMLSYKPKRVRPAQGFMKVVSINTSEPILDSTGVNLSNKTIQWGSDPSELEYERFMKVMNAAFNNNNQFGTPVKRSTNTNTGNLFEIYNFNNLGTELLTNYAINGNIDGINLNFDVLPIDIDSNGILTQAEPNLDSAFSIMYRNDGKGVGSSKTGFFCLLKQGTLVNTIQRIYSPTSNLVIDIPGTGNISEEDFYVQTIDDTGAILRSWKKVSDLNFSNIVLNENGGNEKDLFEVIYSDADITSIKFGDGEFTNVPTGQIKVWYRLAEDNFVRVKAGDVTNVTFNIGYTNINNQTQQLTLTLELQDNMITGLPSETVDEIKRNAPEAFYSKNRMVTGDDYNGFLPTLNNDVLIMKSENRTFSGHSRYVDLSDPTGKSRPLIEFGDDGYIYKSESTKNTYVSDNTSRRTVDLLDEYVEKQLADVGLLNFYYGKLNLAGVTGTASTQYFPSVKLEKTIYYATTVDVIDATSTIITIPVESLYNTLNPFDNFDIDGGMLQIDNELFTYTSIPVITVNAGSFINGKTYTIISIGTTNFTTIGASSNTIGVSFVATGAGIGSGTASTLGNTFTGVLRAQQGTSKAAHVSGSQAFKVRDYRWRYSYNDLTSSNGFISESLASKVPMKLGFTTGGELRAMRPGSLIKLKNDAGNTHWVTVSDIRGDGLGIENIDYVYTGLLSNGHGPIEINASLTTTDRLVEILPPFARVFDTLTRERIIEKLNAGVSFALRFDNITPKWTIIDAEANVIDEKSDYNTIPSEQGDRSWLLYVKKESNGWSIINRQLDYIFGSEGLIRFYNINFASTFNPNFKTVSNDYISLVTIDSHGKLNVLKKYRISGYYVYDDGYTDNSKVKITPLDLDNDFLPDDPEHFLNIVGANQIALVNYDEGEFSYNVPAELSTPEEILNIVDGKLGLAFKWEHNTPIDQTLNPSLTNIIDAYVLTKSYNDDYVSWKKKSDVSIAAPLPPTAEELRDNFSGLTQYKMMTDEIIFHPVKFKPLFGTLADSEFQAQFKVVKSLKTKLTDSEIKSKVINAIDTFFTPGNFGFGEIFYFTELAAYIHSALTSDLNSVVIVPLSTEGRFGTLFQIQPDRNEVVTSVAGVSDIIVINEITDTNIRISR